MAASVYSAEAVRSQLERVLSSPGFVRNERLSRFLRVVVERHLEGRDSDLKESIIGIEVFGRKPGFDTKQDATVRSEAARLRSRLFEYYASQGVGDPLIIELPKGGYTPAFRQPAAIAARRTPRLRAWHLGVLAATALALLALGWWWRQHEKAPIAIAVLPLTNLGQDPANDYFADGLTAELIRDLSIIDGLTVRSHTSSFAFKGKPRNIREAGAQLRADFILEGSVLRDGSHLRINAQLIRVRDDLSFWSGRYDRELAQVLAIQDEISSSIVNSLRLKLGRGRRRYETSTEAYDLYLRARALEARGELAGYRDSVGTFQEAIGKDRSFAPAYAGLAAAYAANTAQIEFQDTLTDTLKRMRAAAETAIRLDPLLAEAHDALGMAYAREGEWQRSEKSFRRAIELEPCQSVPYRHFATYLLLVLGRVDDAVSQLRAAEKCDPISSQVQASLAYVLLSAGRYDDALSHCQKLPPDFPAKPECLGRARLAQGKTGEALQILTTAVNRGVPAGAPVRGYLGYAYGRAGYRQQAEKFAVAAAQNPFQQALTFAGLGDKDRTIEALDRMAVLGPFRIGRTLTFPELALVRDDPRLKGLRKKVGLPE